MDQARAYYNVGKRINFIQIIMWAIIVYFSNEWIVNFFTDNKNVKEVWTSSITIFCLSLLPDFTQTYLKGVITGLGIQNKLVYVTLIVYWLINLPLCYFLAFVLNIGYIGLWLGICISLMIVCICFERKI